MTDSAQPIASPSPAHDARARWGVPRCGYRANAAMLYIATRVLWLGYLLVWLAAIYFFFFVPKARRASMRYLDLLHAPRRRSVLARIWQTYRHMVEFGLLLLDRTLMLARPGHGFSIHAEGLANLAEATRPGNGALLLSAHLGNAEIAAPHLRRLGIDKPFHIVMYMDASHGTERFFARHRDMLQGVNIISTTDPLSAGTSIMAALKKGEVVAMRADRTLSGRGVPVTLLGQPVNLPAGPFLAAALTGVPVVYVYTCRLGAKRYACRMSVAKTYGETPEGKPRDERIAEAAQDFANHMESMLREFPYQWVNFYDYWQQQRAPS